MSAACHAPNFLYDDGRAATERLDPLRVIALSRVARCARCPRLQAFQATLDDGRARPVPPVPADCRLVLCRPLAGRLGTLPVGDRVVGYGPVAPGTTSSVARSTSAARSR